MINSSDNDFNLWGDEFGDVHAMCTECSVVVTYSAGDINLLSELNKLCEEHVCA